MLSKQGLLVIKWREFMLTGGIDFICIDCTQVKEVKPPLSTNSDHKVLAKQNKTDKHNDLTIHIIKIFMFFLCNLEQTFPLLQTSPTATQVSWKIKTQIMYIRNDGICLYLVFALTMPTHVLVIQGLDSSFLYTSNFPLVSPTTSSFSCSKQSQTALTLMISLSTEHCGVKR